MAERKRGRRLGEKVGEGPVQQFMVRRGGARFLRKMYRELQSADAVARYITRRYSFYCSGNTIRNLMKSYHIPLNASGGDRRSKKHREFIRQRGVEVE